MSRPYSSFTSSSAWEGGLTDSLPPTSHPSSRGPLPRSAGADSHRSLASSVPPQYDYSSPPAARMFSPATVAASASSHPLPLPPAAAPPSWSDALLLNAWAHSCDPLPQPYGTVQAILEDVVARAMEEVGRRMREGEGDGAAPRGIVVEGTEGEAEAAEAERAAKARVHYASQRPIQSSSDMRAAAPNRVVVPLLPPAAAPSSSPAPSFSASCAARSLDGRVAVVGGRSDSTGGGGNDGGGVYVADLAQSMSFMFGLTGAALGSAAGAGAGGGGDSGGGSGSDGPVTAVAISPLPIQRGDEDPHGDEAETSMNYLVAWTCGGGGGGGGGHVVRVATLNAFSWQVYEGCSIPMPSSSSFVPPLSTKHASALKSLLPPSNPASSPTTVCSLQFSPDGTHLSVGTMEGSHTLFALRPHRYDPALEPPRVSQKEQLLGVPGAGTGGGAAGAGGGAGMQSHVNVSAADLSAVLSEAHLASSSAAMDRGGFVEMEVRSTALQSVQSKLYTAQCVLHAPVPRLLLEDALGPKVRSMDTAAAAAAQAAAAAAQVAQLSARGAVGATPLASPSAGRAGSAAVGSGASAAKSKRSSQVTDAASTAAAAEQAAAAAAAATAAAAAAAAASDAAASASLPFDPSRPLVPSSLYFLTSPRERRVDALLGLAPHSTSASASSGVAIVWEGDVAWHRWDLSAVRPVLPGQSAAALALAAAKAGMVTTTQGSAGVATAGGNTAASTMAAVAVATKGAPAGATAGGKGKEKDSGTAAPAASSSAAAAAASSSIDSSLFLRPLPATASTPTGCRIGASALDSSRAFFALGLRSGAVVLHDLHLGAVRTVLRGPTMAPKAKMPQSTGGADGARSTEQDGFALAPPVLPPQAVTSLAFSHRSFLLAGLADSSLRLFSLPERLGAEGGGPNRLGEAQEAKVWVSAKLPGGSAGVRSIRVLEESLPTVAIVGVSPPAAAASASSGGKEGGKEVVQEFFLYDMASNYFIGKLVPPSAASAAGPLSPSSSSMRRPFSPSHDGSPPQSSRQALHMSSTGDFTVHVHREDESDLYDCTNGESMERQTRGDVPSLWGRGGGHAGDAGKHSTDVSFHPLSMSHSPFVSFGGDQIVMLGSSSRPSSPSSSPSGTSSGSSSSLLLYSLPGLISSLYPHLLSSCPNGFERQRHAVGLFRFFDTHAKRRAERGGGGAGGEGGTPYQRYMAAMATQQESYAQPSFARSPSKSGSIHPTAPHRALSTISSADGSVSLSMSGRSGPGRLGSTPLLRGGSASSLASSSSHVLQCHPSHSRPRSRSRSRSRSPERRAASGAVRRALHVPPAPVLQEGQARDAAFLVASVMAATIAAAAQRTSGQLKARRAEMAAQMQAQPTKQQQQQAQLLQTQRQARTSAVPAGGLPRLVTQR